MADAQVLSQEYSDQLLPNTAMRLIGAVFVIFGNFIVLLMYIKYVQDKTVVDPAGYLSNVVETYLDNTMRYVYPSVYLCKTLSFFIIMTGGFSAHTILVIALQRYLIICRPFGPQMSGKSCISILLIFLFSVGYAAPMLRFGGFYNTVINRNSAGATRNISVSI